MCHFLLFNIFSLYKCIIYILYSIGTHIICQYIVNIKVVLSNDCAYITCKIAIYVKLLLDIIFDVKCYYELHTMLIILILLHVQYSIEYIYSL